MRDTLIIIDDNELDLAILNEIFKNLFKVKCFSSTAKAVSYLHENQNSVSLVLLDICLGRTGAGFGVLQYIQGHKSLKDIPIILITSDAHEDYVREAISNGAVDFLAKPVDPHAVTERVYKIVKNIWPEDELCIGEQLPTENQDNKQEIEFTIDEVIKISKETLDKIQTICKIRNVISIPMCLNIHKITTILAKTYFEMEESSIKEIDAEMIGYAAIFYDIGRIGIPDKHLQSDFDSNISDIYSQHTSIGHEFFISNHFDNKFYRYCAEIAYWHHKNIDGSGYPIDANSSDIPISAQLVRTALRFYFYAERFKCESQTINRILNSLSSEINNTISYRMYNLIQKSYDSLNVLLNEMTF